jgi:hypothetical protein
MNEKPAAAVFVNINLDKMIAAAKGPQGRKYPFRIVTLCFTKLA